MKDRKLFKPSTWFNSTLKNPDDALLDALTLNSSSGVTVTEDKALRVAAVYSCVRVLSTTFAALPLHLKRDDGDSTVTAKDHPLNELLHILPNNEMTAYNHRQLIMSALLLKGTSFNEIARDGRGRVREITPLCGDMNVTRSKSGALVYEYEDGRTFDSSRIWRISGYSDNGIIGRTPIELARETIGQAIAASEYGGNNFKNGGRPSGVLEIAQRLDPEQRKEVLDAWNRSHMGSGNSGKTALVHNGAKFTPISMSAQDAQFIETLKLQRTEIAGFYGVPPHMIGDLDRATFSNIEHQSLNFVIYSLLPHLVNFEQTVYRDLLTKEERKSYKAKFNVEGLLRGDSKSRAEFYKALHNMGAIQTNEIRAHENMNPVDGGDARYMQINMGKIDENGNIGQENEATQQVTESD